MIPSGEAYEAYGMRPTRLEVRNIIWQKAAGATSGSPRFAQKRLIRGLVWWLYAPGSLCLLPPLDVLKLRGEARPGQLPPCEQL